MWLDADLIEPRADRWRASLAPAARAAQRAAVLIDELDHVMAEPALERWLCRELSLLPSGSLVVLACRQAPSIRWQSEWLDRFHAVPLGPLDGDQSRALLSSWHVEPRHRARIAELGCGHPLTLAVGAALASSRGEIDDLERDGSVLWTLLAAVAPTGSSWQRRALECAAAVPVLTEPLALAMMGRTGERAYAWLRGQPYVALGDGLRLHDYVRDLVWKELGHRNRERQA